MKRKWFLFICALLCSCGASSRYELKDIDVPASSGLSDEKNLPYPGFYELSDSKKAQVLSDSDFHDGYYDRHESNLRNDQEFVSEIIELDSAGLPAPLERGESIMVDFGISELFHLSGKTNYVDIFISWSKDVNFSDLSELKYFLCDPSTSKSLTDDSFRISESEWEQGKMTITVPFESPGEFGLCMQYKDYAAIVYDELLVSEYSKEQQFDVVVANVGSNVSFKESDLERQNSSMFYRAGVKINFLEKLYQIPEDFEFDSTKGHAHINQRESYLFVAADPEKCPSYINDDLTWINQRIKHDIEDGKLPANRVAVVYNLETVKFWNFSEQVNGSVAPCLQDVEKSKRPLANTEYKVGILNTKLEDCLPKESNSDIDYSRLFLKWTKDTGWQASDGFNTYPASMFHELFSPKCHVFYDMDRFGNRNSRSDSDRHYLENVIPSAALGKAETIELGITGKIIGVRSYNNPLHGIRTFMHELGHLLGLSDVDQDDNLMHWNKANDSKLNNKSLDAKSCRNCNWQIDAEKQWDCLHGINSSFSCLQENLRNF